MYTEFTIEETLDYFGRIYGMKRSLVKEQIDFLLGFLDLPEKDRLIRTLRYPTKPLVFRLVCSSQPRLLCLSLPTVKEQREKSSFPVLNMEKILEGKRERQDDPSMVLCQNVSFLLQFTPQNDVRGKRLFFFFPSFTICLFGRIS